MRTLWIPALALAALTGASALSHANSSAPAPLQDDATGGEVELLRTEVDELKRELEKTQALLDDTVKYLQDQAKSQAEMTSVLAASEDAGFTFGINPKSRELLLAGWRKQLAAAQKGIPTAKKTAAPSKPTRLPRGARPDRP